VFEDCVTSGLVLGVERVQADLAPVQVEFLEQLPCDGISLVLMSTMALPK